MPESVTAPLWTGDPARGLVARCTNAVLLDELCPREAAPPALFAAAAMPGSDALMAAMDRINARFGRGTLVPAAVGVAHPWATRAAHRTLHYTTRLAELPLARA